MRWFHPVCLLSVLGCSFDPSGLGSTSTDADPTAPDANTTTLDADPNAPDATPAPDAPPVDPTTSRLIDITDAAVSGAPHANFPLLVSLSATWLRHTASGGDVAHMEGFDISFSADLARTMPPDHEIELYDSGAGELAAWVRIPSLSPTTVLYIHYGDPDITASQENVTAVWNAGYAAVWHLLGDFVDSTGNNGPGANSGSVGADGQIVSGRQFDGDNDFINAGSNAAIDNVFAGGGTAEAWFFAVDWGENNFGRILDKGDTSGWSMFVDDNNVNDGFSFVHGTSTSYDQWISGTQTVTLNSWHHAAVVYDNSSGNNTPTIYIDGIVQSLNAIIVSSSSAIDDGSRTLYIGNRSTISRTFDGTIDEARLSTVPRSAGWVTTGYANQNNPAGFYTVGPPQ